MDLELVKEQAAAGRVDRGAFAAAQLQHRRRRPAVVRAVAGPARGQGRRLRQLVDRHLDQAMSARPTACWRTSPSIDFVNYVQADTVKAGLAGTPDARCRCCRSRRRSTGARRSRPGRHHPRRRRPLHLRQHAARREGHRRAGQGLPGVLRAVLQAGHRHRGPCTSRRHQRGDANGPERHARLQLRHRRRARPRR